MNKKEKKFEKKKKEKKRDRLKEGREREREKFLFQRNSADEMTSLKMVAFKALMDVGIMKGSKSRDN